MTLTSIGIFILSLAFFILVIFLSRLLSQLTDVLHGANRTMEKLPNQLDGIMHETTTLLKQTNRTVDDMNEKLSTLTPLFYVLQDLGNSTKYLTTSLTQASQAIKKNTYEANDERQLKKTGFLYTSFALGYYLLQKRREKDTE